VPGFSSVLGRNCPGSFLFRLDASGSIEPRRYAATANHCSELILATVNRYHVAGFPCRKVRKVRQSVNPVWPPFRGHHSPRWQRLDVTCDRRT
jgi:hypothetical protein